MSKRTSEEEVRAIVNLKYSKFEYIGGYVGARGNLYLECMDCGNVFKHNAQIVRASRLSTVECDCCNIRVSEINKQKANELKKKLQLQNIKLTHGQEENKFPPLAFF